MALNEKAREAQREYMRRYREKNRERINKQNREWRANNPDKVKAIRERYLNNLADRYKQEG